MKSYYCNYNKIKFYVELNVFILYPPAPPISEQMDVTAEARTVVKEGLCQTEALRDKAVRLMCGTLLLLLLALLPCLCHSSFSTAGFLGAVCIGALLSGALLYLLFTTHIKVLKETEDQMLLTSDELQTKLTGCRVSGSSSSDGSPELQPSRPFKREE